MIAQDDGCDGSVWMLGSLPASRYGRSTRDHKCRVTRQTGTQTCGVQDGAGRGVDDEQGTRMVLRMAAHLGDAGLHATHMDVLNARASSMYGGRDLLCDYGCAFLDRRVRGHVVSLRNGLPTSANEPHASLAS